MNERTKAITRLVVLVVLLLNQGLVTLGYNPLPFSEEQIFEAVSAVAAAVMAIITWWYNNSVTEEAIEAQKDLDRKKKYKKA